MRTILWITLWLIGFQAFGQDYHQTISQYRDSVVQELYSEGVFTVDSSSLKDHVRFYPPDSNWRISARLVRDSSNKVFRMATSTTRRPNYALYGRLFFEVDGAEHVLEVYQSVDLLKNPDYADYLFCPFKDGTNEDSTYGGGRYLDLRLTDVSPSGRVELDFNKCYNPYCAYNYKYSCPIPPKANWLPIRIEAGVKRPSEVH
jgi:hypothetical protein